MTLFEDGKIAITYLYASDLKELDLEESDSDQIVYFGRDIDTVEVSIFCKEREDGTYKMSLRSNDYVDVSVVCSKYGGGGHVRAAGFESSMTLEQIKQAVIEEVKKQLQ